MPPHSTEAEQGVIGCILISPDSALAVCITSFKDGSSVFYDLRHRTIYETAIDRYNSNKAIDIITLVQHLRDNGVLDAVGGYEYLSSLPDSTPSAENISYYIDIILKKYALRRVLAACSDISNKAIEEPDNVNEIVSEATVTLQAVADITIVSDNFASAKQLVPEAMEYIESLSRNSGNVSGIQTGFPDLDSITWGLKPTEFIVIAGRTSQGKTALAMNIADHAAVNLAIPVGVFSMEMSKQALMVRMLCSRANVSQTSVRQGNFSDYTIRQLIKASKELKAAPLHIDDSSALSISQLRARAKQMQKRFGIKLVVVDYLQLMHANVRRTDNRQMEVAYISSGLKALAKDLGIPVLVLAQLSRKVEDRGNNSPPKISDLRESGSIEQDADVVMMLHRHVKPEEYSPVIPTKCIVAKNRDGPTGEVDLVFVKSCTRFESVTHEKPTNIEPYPTDDTML